MNIPQSVIDRINQIATIYDVISDFVDLKKQGASFYGKCPMCGAEGKGKGLIVTPGKKIYKCFHCDFNGTNPIKFLMEQKGKTYPEALKYLADKYNITIIEDRVPEKPQKKKKPSTAKIKTFRDKQLEESGINDEDQKASVYVDDDTRSLVDIFESGTLDQYKQIVYGDDMIIWYYDLNGKPIMYQKPKTNRFEHLFRVRWQNPLLHLDKEGRPIKYQSPVGSGSHIYIPEAVRRAYQAKQHHKTLYIQEGEKKAEKACKHSLFSIGIMGIHNIAYNKQLPFEIQLIIKTLAIEEVVFVLDADWNAISDNIKPGDWVDRRPYSFYKAVINFRDYFRAFTNLSIYLEIYFAYILPTENHDKGIDDLLTHTLKNKEDDLLTDINTAINEKEGKGQYIQFHKISTVPDTKLLELWNLDSAEKFAETHREKLINIPEFRINKLKWRFNKESKLELAQPLMPEETYWQLEEYEDKAGRTHKRYSFDYENAYNFLRNRGYGRILMLTNKYEFGYHENNIVTITEPYQIKDFVVRITREIAPKEIRNMLFRGAKMYLGPDSLSNLDFMIPEFKKPNHYSQDIYFKNKFWHITGDKIIEKNLTDLEQAIWSDNINSFEARLLSNMADIIKITDEVLLKFPEDKREYWKNYKGKFFIEETSDAHNCHFFQFLKNTGEFYWDKLTFDQHRQIITDTRTNDEKLETNLHLVSKMSAMGYLLHRYRSLSECKAIIAMDGKLSEIGSSNGRSGKSIVGFAIGKVVPQVYIGGKNKYLTDDRFIFEEVTEKTCNLFIDDVRANVYFEFFFPLLGGRVTIEKKAIGKVTYPDDKTPKLYISTNHAINGEGGSHRDRQFIIAFSDYYNENFKPVHQFGVTFFDEWDNEQWNLFYNLMALCLQVYLRFGLVEQPLERIEKRRLRQEIGEDFICWADEYFSYSEEVKATSNINTPLQRKELYDSFLERNQAFKKFYTPNNFKKKFKKWCLYNGLKFNAHRFDKTGQPGADDKTNGIEFFMVSNDSLKNIKL